MQFSWDFLNTLAQQHGDAFYLVDSTQFLANYQEFLQAFRCVYPNTQIAYSYKTNYLPKFCELVQAQGGYAEVVSGMEYCLALRIGVPAARIIFNGPYKRRDDFQMAALNGSIINLDAAYEIPWLQAIAEKYPEQTLRIGLRCNFSLAAETQRSRFGFDVETDDFLKALRALQRLPNCQIVGLHCHYLAAERSPQAYQAIAKRLLALATEHFGNQPLEFIDLGGGFFSHMRPELKQQFNFRIPSFTEYGQAIGEVFANAFPQSTGPELILEPGLALTADAMQFIAEVIHIKQLGARQLALIAGSIYDIKPTLSQRQLPMAVVPSNAKTQESRVYDLVGYTCMENDCLYRGFTGVLAPGDFVVFENVGAYTNVLRPPFINPAPPILSFSASGNVEVLRRRETAADVFETYTFAD